MDGHTFPVDDILHAIKVSSKGDSDSIFAVGDHTLYVYDGATIGNNIRPYANFSIATELGGYLYDLAVNPNNSMVYMTNRGSDIVYALNETSRNITRIHVGGQGGTTGVVVNPKTNMVYVGNPGCNTVSVINGISNSLINNIPVGIEPRDLAINLNNSMIYVANRVSGSVSAIDGVKNKLTVVARFSITPQNAGFIECNGTKISSNYSRYDVDTLLQCEAIANNGFTFSSWSGDYLPNNLAPKPVITFKVSKYGALSGNFIRSNTLSVPPEIWVPLYGLIPGLAIPSILSWLNGKRQRKHLEECINQIGRLDKKAIEERITRLYIDGKINESHRQLLKDKISEYYDIGSTGSPIK